MPKILHADKIPITVWSAHVSPVMKSTIQNNKLEKALTFLLVYRQSRYKLNGIFTNGFIPNTEYTANFANFMELLLTNFVNTCITKYSTKWLKVVK